MPCKRPPADLTVLVTTDTSAETFEIDAQELCHQSFVRNRRRSPIAVLFFSSLYVSTEAAAYRRINGALPPELEDKVSIWARTDPDDRAIVIQSLNKELSASCLRILEEKPHLDCRIVTVTHAADLSEHLRDACALSFCHMPVNSDDDVQRSVDYAMSLQLNHLTDARPNNRILRRHVSTVAMMRDCHDSSASKRLFLRSHGVPLRFEAPFINAGFSINSRIVRDTSDGALVTSAAKGTALYGPYLPVSPGRYHALMQIRGAMDNGSALMNILRRSPSGTIAVDAYLSGVDTVLQTVRVDASTIGLDPTLIELSFTIPEYPEIEERPKLELRLHQQSNRACLVEFIELTWLDG
jgi:hypothetical protein